MDTLVLSYGYCYLRDSHPIDSAHAGRKSKKTASEILQLPSFTLYSFLY